jgi:hypothetical protein
MNRSQALKPRWRLVKLLANVNRSPLALVIVSVVKVVPILDNFALVISPASATFWQFNRRGWLQERINDASKEFQVLLRPNRGSIER